jgi:hypothetical protein
MLSQFLQNSSQSVAASIVALACVFALGLLQMPQLTQLRNGAKNVSPEALQTEVKSEKIRLNLLQKVPAFGFDNLLGDWAFLNFIQYFGDDEARAATGYRLSPDYFDVIIDRDPKFLQGYFFLSGSSSLYAGMPERSVALMEKGLKSLSPQSPPKSYYVWRYKATDELLFIGDAQAARESYEKAAEWASTYSDEESKNIVAISRRSAGFLARNPLSKSAQVNAWSTVLSNALDDRTRQLAISRIEALGGKVLVTPQGVRIQLPKTD